MVEKYKKCNLKQSLGRPPEKVRYKGIELKIFRVYLIITIHVLNN